METAEPQDEPAATVEQQEHEEQDVPQATTTIEEEVVETEAEPETERETKRETESPDLVETTTEEELAEDNTATSTAPLPPQVVDEATQAKADNDTRPIRVLFLSDETGGGHRASAEALGKQVCLYFFLNIYVEV